MQNLPIQLPGIQEVFFFSFVHVNYTLSLHSNKTITCNVIYLTPDAHHCTFLAILLIGIEAKSLLVHIIGTRGNGKIDKSDEIVGYIINSFILL